ncbi:MAG: short-chain dehydrogenase, partial [Firmicutes bacterium]|nr:short-chain dehydrogenase [Bacillota bacterium]
ELKPRGIKVMAVCPGWIKTEFFDRAVRDDTVSYFNRYYSAKQVIEQALIDMDKGKDVSVLGGPEKRQVWLVKHLPHRFVMRTWCRQQGKK